jgi:nucleoside-diphosphate-sugar epimerase
VRRARGRGIAVRSLARRSHPALATPDDHVLGTWTAERLAPMVAGVDAVIHCASVVHKPGAPSEEYTRFNVAGMRALCEACRIDGAPRIVYLSTIKVYGESPLGTIDEHTRLAPESAYARSKLEAEHVLAEHGPEHVILRLCPVFGVGDKGNVRTMIRAIARRRFAVPGDGSNRKSLVHVSSVAEVALAACARGSGVFVVADREVPSVAQLSDTIARTLGRWRPLRVPAAALYLAAAGCEVGYRVLRREPRIQRALIRKALLPSECDPRRVLSALQVDCHRDLREAIAEEVAWLRELGEI